MNKISVAEALRKAESGESLEGYEVDFEKVKVEALDVMKLAKSGIQVPEDVIYYDDDDIEDDDEFAGEWIKIDYDPIQVAEAEMDLKINLRPETKNWIEQQGIELNTLVEELLDNFYQTQKLISKE